MTTPRRGRKINRPTAAELAKKKASFLDAFERTATIDGAARAIGIARQTHYQWMAKDPDYAIAYARADEVATERLEQEARRRAMIGTEEPVFHRGKVCGHVRKYSDVLLIFLLKARRPETYRERFEHRVSEKEQKPLVIDLVTDRAGLIGAHQDDDTEG